MIKNKRDNREMSENQLSGYERKCIKTIIELVKHLEKAINENYQGFEFTHSQYEALEVLEKLSQGKRGY